MNFLKLTSLCIFTIYSVNAIWFFNETDMPLIVYKKDTEIVELSKKSYCELELDESFVKKSLDLKTLESGVQLRNIGTDIIRLTDISSDSIIFFDLDEWRHLHILKFSVKELGLATDADGQSILKKIREQIPAVTKFKRITRVVPSCDFV